MIVEFKKISNNGINFEIQENNIKFYGIAKKIDKNIIKSTGMIEGSFIHCCDRCGKDFTENIKQEFEIFASQGVYKDDKYMNLIEFFDDSINFDTMLESELESFRCDYLYCDKCSI